MVALAGLLETKNAQRTVAAVASGALHLAIFIVAFVLGGKQEGIGANDQAFAQLVLIEAPEVDRAEGVELRPIEPMQASVLPAEISVSMPDPPLPASEAVRSEPEDQQITPPQVEAPPLPPVTPPVEQPEVTFLASIQEQTSLPQRLAKLAEELQNKPETPLHWEQDGKQYTAKMIWERARDGTALDRVIAEVSASDQGKLMSTRIMLKRLAFSQFTQVVDRWDPMVQLHDDVIVGRFHSNSQFNVFHDSRVGPKFLGKVTTAAKSFEMSARGRGRQSDIFAGGIETRTNRINLPQSLQPFAWAPYDPEARIHQLTDDTRIRFFADGSYMWRTNNAPGSGYMNKPSEHPVYFVGNMGSTLYVQGIVSGNMLVYSPTKIVIEDDLTYANDPRRDSSSRDYLGLVSDRYIEIASPGTTGPGDLTIHAAIFAGRRFVVRDIDHPRSATLKVFGSLSAGSLSASEPRYATEIEYDSRFEQRRPPGFPMTTRYEAERWSGQWVETSERMADDTL
ncbi:hypothetical protein [Peristeroidobacter agariperforans]|uniref:hypothetical protein n=1 Tax=Peristeroidobacter agariperforans TaxID=268404 RepID=UPI00101C4A1E|nr:hypothetical protein [Peristeroidobacter agariperforans]